MLCAKEVSLLFVPNRCQHRQVREGFIVEDEEEPEERERRKREKKKRRREERDEEEAGLDEEDLDLIGEAIPGFERHALSEVRVYLLVGLKRVF